MTFDDLLDRLYMADFEVTKFDWLLVIKSYGTKEEFIFHNSSANDVQEFIDKHNPIFCMYNGKGYDKYILKSILLGYTIGEIKQVNDFIIAGNNGWEYPFDGYCELPYIWDLFDCIKTFKSLKEIEANLRMDITESTIDFNIDHQWNNSEYAEMLYYCEHDVNALFPLFDRLINNYKSKYIISQIGRMEPDFACSLTDANLTAKLLGAERQEHNDPFLYVYPDKVQKEKIPKEFLDYIDDVVLHNDKEYEIDAPCLDLGSILFQTGQGGCHGFIKNGTLLYDRGDNLECE